MITLSIHSPDHLTSTKVCEDSFTATRTCTKTTAWCCCAHQGRTPITALCVSDPLHPYPSCNLGADNSESECMMNSSWKPAIISSTLMCPCCDSRTCSIQPPTPICTCHLLLCPPSMLTSEEAGCPPTSPAECDQLDTQPDPSMQPLCRCCDRQPTQRALLPV